MNYLTKRKRMNKENIGLIVGELWVFLIGKGLWEEIRIITKRMKAEDKMIQMLKEYKLHYPCEKEK